MLCSAEEVSIRLPGHAWQPQLVSSRENHSPFSLVALLAPFVVLHCFPQREAPAPANESRPEVQSLVPASQQKQQQD